MMPVLEAVQPLAMVPAAAPHCLRWLLQMEKESQIEVAVPTVTQRLLQLYIYQPWRQRHFFFSVQCQLCCSSAQAS